MLPKEPSAEGHPYDLPTPDLIKARSLSIARWARAALPEVGSSFAACGLPIVITDRATGKPSQPFKLPIHYSPTSGAIIRRLRQCRNRFFCVYCSLVGRLALATRWQEVAEYLQYQGHYLALTVLTMPHTPDDTMADQYNHLQAAWRRLTTKSRGLTPLERCHIKHWARALDVMIGGKHGPHLHLNVLHDFQPAIEAAVYIEFRKAIDQGKVLKIDVKTPLGRKWSKSVSHVTRRRRVPLGAVGCDTTPVPPPPMVELAPQHSELSALIAANAMAHGDLGLAQLEVVRRQRIHPVKALTGPLARSFLNELVNYAAKASFEAVDDRHRSATHTGARSLTEWLTLGYLHATDRRHHPEALPILRDAVHVLHRKRAHSESASWREVASRIKAHHADEDTEAEEIYASDTEADPFAFISTASRQRHRTEIEDWQDLTRGQERDDLVASWWDLVDVLHLHSWAPAELPDAPKRPALGK